MFLVFIYFILLKSHDDNTQEKRIFFFKNILSQSHGGLNDNKQEMLNHLDKSLDFFKYYQGKRTNKTEIQKMTEVILGMGSSMNLNTNSLVDSYLSFLDKRIKAYHELKTTMYSTLDKGVEATQEKIKKRDIVVELNNILSTKVTENDQSEKTKVELSEYFNYIEKLSTSKQKNLSSLELNNKKESGDDFDKITVEMAEDFRIAGYKLSDWTRRRYPELKKPCGEYYNKESISNYDQYYEGLSLRLLDWKEKREKQKKIFESNQLTFDGITKHKMKDDPLSIKNDLELELYRLHKNLAESFNSKDSNNEIEFEQEFPYYEIKKADPEEKEYKEFTVFDASGNHKKYQKRTIKKTFINKDRDVIDILNEIYACLIETNNCKQSKNIELAEQIAALKEKIEEKRAIRKESKGFEDECAVMMIDFKYKINDIIKDSMASFFAMILPKFDYRFYYEKKDIDRDAEKYTEYKIESNLESFFKVGGGIDFNLKIYDNCVQESLGMATFNSFNEELFYQKIKEYSNQFTAVSQPNDFGAARITEKMNNTYSKQIKSFEEVQLEILKNISSDTKNYLKATALIQERQSYYYSDPILQTIMKDNCLLYQNGFYSRNYNYERGQSYYQYIQSLIENLSRYAFLRTNVKNKSDQSNKNILDQFIQIEKIYFKLLLLEYNEHHNFEVWWSIYEMQNMFSTEKAYNELRKKISLLKQKEIIDIDKVPTLYAEISTLNKALNSYTSCAGEGLKESLSRFYTNISSDTIDTINNKLEDLLNKMAAFKTELDKNRNIEKELFGPMLDRTLELQERLSLTPINKTKENNVIDSSVENTQCPVYAIKFNQELQNKIDGGASYSDIQFDLRESKIANLKKYFLKNLLIGDKHVYIPNENWINNMEHRNLYEKNNELDHSNAIIFKSNFLNTNQEYQIERVNRATDIVVEGMSKRHFDVLDKIYINPLSSITHNISQNVFDNESFWSDVIFLYKTYFNLNLEKTDVRLDYYIQKKFDSIFDHLKKNNNISSSWKCRELDDLKNFLQTVENYIKNYKENKQYNKKQVFDEIKRLDFDNEDIHTRISNILLKGLPFGFLLYTNQDYKNIFDRVICDQKYRLDEDHTKVKNKLKESIDSLKEDDLLKLCLFYYSDERYMFYHTELNKDDNRWILIEADALKIKNNALKEKNKAYFTNNVLVYHDLIESYKNKSLNYLHHTVSDHYLDKIINMFLELDSNSHLKKIVEDLFYKYEMEESNRFIIKKHDYNYKLIFNSQNQDSIKNKIKTWLESGKDNNGKINKIHQLYIGYSCASIIEGLLQYLYKDKYDSNNYPTIQFYITKYKKIYDYTYAFLKRINSSEIRSDLPDLFDENDMVIEENSLDNLKQDFNLGCQKINEYVDSYKNITMSAGLIEVAKNALSSDVSSLDKDNAYIGDICNDIDKINKDIINRRVNNNQLYAAEQTNVENMKREANNDTNQSLLLRVVLGTNVESMKKAFGLLGKIGFILCVIGGGGYALNKKFEFLPVIFSYLEKMGVYLKIISDNK